MVAMDPGQRQTGSSKIPENRERLLHAQLIKLEAISPRSFGVPDGIGLVFFFLFFLGSVMLGRRLLQSGQTTLCVKFMCDNSKSQRAAYAKKFPHPH